MPEPLLTEGDGRLPITSNFPETQPHSRASPSSSERGHRVDVDDQVVGPQTLLLKLPDRVGQRRLNVRASRRLQKDLDAVLTAQTLQRGGRRSQALEAGPRQAPQHAGDVRRARAR